MRIAFYWGLLRAIWHGLKYSRLPYCILTFTPQYHIPLIFFIRGKWKVNETINKFLTWDKEWRIRNAEQELEKLT